MPEYIDRKALGIGKCNPDIFENKSYANGWNAAIDLLEKAPTADVVEVKHGKWEYQNSDEYSDEYWSDYKCSFCGNIITALSDEDELYNYCPYCGARIDGKE